MRSSSRAFAEFMRFGLIVATALTFAGCPDGGSAVPPAAFGYSADGTSGDPTTVVAGDIAVAPGSDSNGSSDAVNSPDASSADGGGVNDDGSSNGGSGDTTGGTNGESDGGSDNVTTPPPPRLVVSDSLLNFGSDGSYLTIRLSNGGSGNVSFLLSSTDPWISFSPSAGVVGSTPVNVTVSVNRTNLWLGTFWSTVTVSGGDNSNNGIIVIVTKSGVPAPRDQILAWMRELGPLNRRHFSWKAYYDFYEDDELLYEYIRINNGVSWADWPNGPLIDKLVRMCKLVNQSNPVIPATIAFVDSPYTRYWPPTAPPTYNGPERAQEIAAHSQQLSLLKSFLDASNARYSGPDIPVTAIIYDTELWMYRQPNEPDYLAWNAAIRQNYDDLTAVTRTWFPNSKLEWYSRGWIRFFGNREPVGWAVRPYEHFDMTEQGDSCSAIMYRLPMQGPSRESYIRTAAVAAANGVPRTTPWLAIGAGYHPISELDMEYTHNWNYELQVSWNFGREINDLSNRTWETADWVVLYPSPFQAATPYYGQHYVAYVRGAHNLPTLPR